jgi:hypothetical protein
MAGISIDWRTVRRELTDERAKLFERFVENPADVRLAEEIKQLDDRILQCKKHVQVLPEADSTR